jgi:hypothetical protein
MVCLCVLGTASATNAQSLADLLSRPPVTPAGASGPAWVNSSWLAEPSDNDVFGPIDRIVDMSGLRQSDIDSFATRGSKVGRTYRRTTKSTLV